MAAVMGNTKTFSNRVERAGAGSRPGSEELEEMVNAGLSILDDGGTLRPLLAEAVPSTDNGLWKLLPDGRMETTWRLKRGVEWHDRAPFTAGDLVFTAAVIADDELRAFRDLGVESVESVEAPDPFTVIVRWRRAFIEADRMFTRLRGQPLPRHLPDKAYQENRAGFLDLPYWSVDFVGMGPFKLREWVGGSHAVLEANDRYILGRPKLDAVEVRFIPDYNALIANILAGAVQLTLGRNLSLDQAMQIRDQWREGKIELGAFDTWIAIYPQVINPSPAIIANLDFRRALYHGVDRQQMADTLMLGMVPIAHSIIPPQDPEFAEADRETLRYEYDPRRTATLLDGLGYARGNDGMYRDAAGQSLAVQTQTSVGNALQEKSMFAVADAWRRVGVGVEEDVISAQARSDRARRSGRSGFEVQKQPSGALDGLPRHHGSQTPLPENNFVGNNRSRYRSAELDGLMDTYFTTIPRAERGQLLGRIVRHMTEHLSVMGLIYDVDPAMIHQRLDNVTAARAQLASVAWNAHAWDVK